MIKKLMTIMLLVLTLLGLNACNRVDVGVLKNWTVQDDVISWEEIPGVKYYEIDFFSENDLEELVTYLSDYAYTNSWSFNYIPNNENLNLKIKVFYEDGDIFETEMVSVLVDREFPHPTQMGTSYIGSLFSWDSYSEEEPGFVNYTIKVNGVEYTVDSHEFDLSTLSDSLYEIYVRSNYQNGSSKYSDVYYGYFGSDSDMMTIYYDLESNEDFEFTLGDQASIIYISSRWGTRWSTYLPSSIATIENSTIRINKEYIKNEASEGSIIISFRVLTEETFYSVYVVSNEDLVVN